MNLTDYIVFETERQYGTVREGIGMLRAYERVCFSADWRRPVTEGVIKDLSGLITGNHEYRVAPAVFNHGVPAVNHQLIPRLMGHWVNTVNTDIRESYPGDSLSWTDRMVKEFLSIHPFADGNGRVASLIWNYLNNTLESPEPMPYLFGENHE